MRSIAGLNYHCIGSYELIRLLVSAALATEYYNRDPRGWERGERVQKEEKAVK